MSTVERVWDRQINVPMIVRTATLSSAAATTPAYLVDPEEFPGYRIRLLKWSMYVDGAAWTFSAPSSVSLRGTDGTLFVLAPSASLTLNVFLTDGSAGLTIGEDYSTGIGIAPTIGVEVVAAEAATGGGDLIAIALLALFPENP